MAELQVKAWLHSFEKALQERDVNAASELFVEEECFWRDLLAFTWNLYTAESREEIRVMLAATLDAAQPRAWQIEGHVEEAEATLLIQAFIRFETQQASCRGHLKLRAGKCWCLLTAMHELKGFEEKAGLRRDVGLQHVPAKGRKTWQELRAEEIQEIQRSKETYCVIVGGGQAGVALAARLRRLGVVAIIIEKNKRAGDTWRNRYRSLCLHSPVWYAHFPYMPFPDDWPVYISKDRMGDWIEAYTEAMGLMYWTATECKGAKYAEEHQRWEVRVEREGEEMVLHCKQLVLATGMSGFPHVPIFKGAESFKGVQMHSSQYRGGQEWADKHCVVVGGNNSAHDICADLWECGAARVTMLQRSPTQVVRYPAFAEAHAPLYCADSKYSTTEADLMLASFPYKLLPRLQAPLYMKFAAMDKSFYQGLANAGFMHTFGEDHSGIFSVYYRRGSGFYVDVGASELVINGEIKVKSRVEVEEVKASSVVLSDGSEVEADLIVYATGWSNMNAWAASLISQEVADKVGKCWGLGSNTVKDPGPWEREIRNMWKPTQVKNLWFHGGSFQEARHYSLYLALQIKARLEGIPTRVYGMPLVHHTS
ncbi:hypothetical protein GOP47_0019277 [Adiantum capillus-veneris]|uniref:indole-3-pyruvate monooxygenase n=1 Tax=Adiantum capillus-veneris TaxID=13818 RepID=A0A9D4Z8X8_ADICA|nr:hypothetical protein GOP47_0019277 [Adiantum capillus-veneris]